MITKNELSLIGTINRTHGTQGELQCVLTADVLDSFDMERLFLFVEIDSLFVPFLLEHYRYKNADTVLLNLNGIETEKDALRLVNCGVYVEKNLLPYSVDNLALNMGLFDALIGYRVVNQDGIILGTIADYDDSTENVLIEIDSGMVLPFHEDLIVSVDEVAHTIQYAVPIGL